MDLKFSDNRHVLQVREKNQVPFLSFQGLRDTGMVIDGFSTKLGGVSQGKYATMNFAYTRGDAPEHVLENFTRMAEALGVERDSMVVSHQTHTVNVRRVTGADKGKGVIRQRDYTDVDGLLTNEPGITLVTFYADCVPLYFVDPVRRAIALSHSGWRGTVNRMGQATLDAMKKEFGTNPADVVAAIGPSICQDCFEVGEEVAEEFNNAFSSDYREELLKEGKRSGKYQLNLWKANEIVLMEAGVKPENIHTTNVCTMCNHNYLFSHRVVGQERGTLAAFLCLKEK